MREKIQRFFIGRYGFDQLSQAMIGGALVLSLLTLFTRWRLLDWAGTALLLVCIYRALSRQILRRQGENIRFLQWWNRVKENFFRLKSRMADQKTHRFFQCPHCGQKVRVPRGRGKICITCPSCRQEFIRKS